MTDTESGTQHEEVVRKYVEEGYNAKNPAVLGETMTDDVVVHGLIGTDGPVEGLEAYGEWAMEILSAMPDSRIEFEDLFSSGDRVVARWRVTGTHEGELMGIEPTGETVEATALTIIRMEDGKIAEKWFQMDDLGLLEQLGAVDL